VTTADLLTLLEQRLDTLSLAVRGWFQPAPEDGVPPLPDGTAAGTLVMVGSVGGAFWPHTQAAPEARGPDPIDRWTARVLGEVAAEIGATALFPFGGPPHHPFQRWARRADPELAPSPLGILVHPDHGLWHALRGALLLRERLAPAELPAPRPSPCEGCAAKPCLAACPVRAFTQRGYDVRACRSYLATLSGQPCMIQGCQARLACPVGSGHAYRGAQAQHHMRAFARG
jgi:ferredoxin